MIPDSHGEVKGSCVEAEILWFNKIWLIVGAISNKFNGLLSIIEGVYNVFIISWEKYHITDLWNITSTRALETDIVYHVDFPVSTQCLSNMNIMIMWVLYY